MQPLELEISRHNTWAGTNNGAKGFESILLKSEIIIMY